MEEVHLWRGTEAQRALRGATRTGGPFRYFDTQLGYPDWPNLSVLDFGSNQGYLLSGPGCPIEPRNYCGMDVLRDAVAAGRRRFPDAQWLHFDRYNCSFNPGGDPDCAIPDPGRRFDVILAYSVFTHTTREDMLELVGQLRALLAPGGILAFTFIDHRHVSRAGTRVMTNLEWRLRKMQPGQSEEELRMMLRTSDRAAWCALVGPNRIYTETNGSWEDDGDEVLTYHVYYTADEMRRLFPQSEILPPVNGEMQHCCLIRQSAV